MGNYKIEFFGGPLDGVVRTWASLPEVIILPHAHNGVAYGKMLYSRSKDGRANPWRYTYAGMEDR